MGRQKSRQGYGPYPTGRPAFQHRASGPSNAPGAADILLAEFLEDLSIGRAPGQPGERLIQKLLGIAPVLKSRAPMRSDIGCKSHGAPFAEMPDCQQRIARLAETG